MGEPLSVYGVGGQTRAFIYIEDSIRCMVLAIEHPPDDNKIRMYNQTTETHRVVDLAARVSRLFGATVRFLPNPRKCHRPCGTFRLITQELAPVRLNRVSVCACL